MTNIGITTFGADGGRSGIGRYTVNLIQHMAALQSPADYHLYMFQDEQEVFSAEPTHRMQMDLFPTWLKSPVVNIAWHQARLSKWCRQRQHEVLFLPAANRRLPINVPCPTVGTVHDFSSLHVDGKYDPARMFYIKQVLPFLTRRLSHVLTVSESSKRDIVEYAKVAPEKVTVTPLAVDHSRYQRDKSQARERLNAIYGDDRPYLLYVSRIEHPGKNHLRLIEAFNQLKQKEDLPHRLILAGGDWNGAEDVHRFAAESPYSDDIVFTGFVADDELVDLYVCADLLAFPSLYEGFGLPVLEAMASGVPVACADVSSLPEVGGDAVTYFDPQDVDSMTNALSTILQSRDYREESIRRGLSRSQQFTWEATARKTLETILSVSGGVS